MELTPNKKMYWEFVRALRNMDGVRQGFVEQKNISKENHEEYMLVYGKCFYICIVNNTPAGYIGIINNDIRVATHPDYQGQGVGKFMINEIMKNNPHAFAKVKLENNASLRLFESCGFKKMYYILERD